MSDDIWVCMLDHRNPDSLPEITRPIGHGVGWAGWGRFYDLGGFGCPLDIMNTLANMNATYQEEIYTPLHLEAVAIYQWLNSRHKNKETDSVECPVCGIEHTLAEYQATETTKYARLSEIDEIIDGEWRNLYYAMNAIIPKTFRLAYYDWCEGR